jgi:hypothetical protein
MKYLTMINAGAINICKNLLLSAKKVEINVEKDFIIGCLDKKSFIEFKNHKNTFLFTNQKISSYQTWNPKNNSSFCKIVKYKWRIIKKVYKNNKELCYIDSDIVFKKNPKKLIVNKKKILFQMDYPLKKICSGFMVFNNNKETRYIINECSKYSYIVEEDQILINTLMKKKNAKNYRLLNPQFFPNGYIYNLLRNKTESYIVHANHYPLKNIKKKIQYLKNHKLWFLN